MFFLIIRPPPRSTLFPCTGLFRSNTWVEVPVTTAVTTGGLLTLGVRSTNGDGAYYDSRQSGANAPQLIVTYGTPTTTSNSTSPNTSSPTTTSALSSPRQATSTPST